MARALLLWKNLLTIDGRSFRNHLIHRIGRKGKLIADRSGSARSTLPEQLAGGRASANFLVRRVAGPLQAIVLRRPNI